VSDQRKVINETFPLLMVIIGYAGSGRAADLVPSGRVICADGGFCTSRVWSGSGSLKSE